MATHVHTTAARASRRNLFIAPAILALAGAGALAGPAAAAPDAELIRLCGEFDALECEREGLDFDATTDAAEAIFDATWTRIDAAQGVILAAIERHPPATLAGVAALARTIRAEETALHGADPHSPGGRLVWHLVEALAGERA